MSLFSLTQEIAIDLGTANTIIMQNDKIVLDEPSIVAWDYYTHEVIAIGKEAQKMQGKSHSRIETVRPLKYGVIADFNAAELMLRGFIKKISKHSLFAPSLKVVVAIPSGSTEVEIRAVRDSSEHSGGRDVYMIYEPMAAAIGIGLDVEAPVGNMVVDIGGGTAEIATIALGGLVANRSIRAAGDEFTAEIKDYMNRQHSIKIGDTTAEQIKIHVGSALTDLGDDAPEEFVVRGPNKMTSLPMEIPISYQEIAHCLDKSLSRIEAAVLETLDNTPPELYADLVNNGIYLTGGGALLRGLDKRLTDRIKIQFKVGEDPLHAVAHGTGIALKNTDRYKFLFR